MSAFFNSDGSFPLQFLIIFVVIFVVLAVIVLAFRRLSGKGLSLSSKAGPRGRQPRLGIVDIYELDRQRQLILLRRDNVEHLLLVGGPNDVIVERNINRGGGVRIPLDETGRLEPQTEDPIFEPARQADPVAPVTPPFQPPVIELPERRAEEPAPSPAPGVADEAAPQRDLPAEPKPTGRPSRSEVIAARAARRNPPPIANLKAEAPDPQRSPRGRASGDLEPTFEVVAPPAADASRPPTPPPASERSAEKTVQPQSAVQPLPPAPVIEQVPPMPAMVRPTSSRPVDAAILSDMARQLEEALRRPSAAVSPSPPATPATEQRKAPAPEQRRSQVEPKQDVGPAAENKAPVEHPVDPMAAAMAAPPDAAVSSTDAKETRVASAPEPFLPAPPPPAPEPSATAPRRASPPSQNPFSVEEIEAEFARLLGRPLDKKN